MLEQIVKKKKQNLPDRLDAEALRALIFRVCRREEYVRKFSFEQTCAEHDMEFKVFTEVTLQKMGII